MRILITGAGGQLGHDLVAAFDGHDVVAAPRARLDVADRDQVLQVIGHVQPDAVVHAGAWTDVDGCGLNGHNFVKTVLRLAGERDELAVVDDQHGCPTFTPDLAEMIHRLVVARRPGTFHVTNQGSTSWFGFARDILAAAGLDPGRVRPIPTAGLDPPRPAPRPANSVLDNAALRLSGLPLLPDYHEPLERMVKELTR